MTPRRARVILFASVSRRLATSLLSALLVAANVLTGAAACVAVCSSTRLATNDCCRRPDAGIAAPRCCQGAEQVSSATPPAVSSRSQASAESAHYVAFTVPAIVVLPGSPFGSRLTVATAPPGAGALLAQHTSLLL